MPARSDMYRRFAIEAKQQRSRASDPQVRQGFADIADHWAGLAEQSDWLDKRLVSSIGQQQQVISPAPLSDTNLPCVSAKRAPISGKVGSGFVYIKCPAPSEVLSNVRHRNQLRGSWFH